MNLKEKIDFFINCCKNTLCLYTNGQYYLFYDNDEDSIDFDDIDGDDHAFSIKIDNIKDINLKDGIFTIEFTNNDNQKISCLEVKKYNW